MLLSTPSCTDDIRFIGILHGAEHIALVFILNLTMNHELIDLGGLSIRDNERFSRYFLVS